MTLIVEKQSLPKPYFQISKEMREEYMRKRKTELPELIDLLEKKESKTLLKIIHNIRGSGASYDFIEITTAAAALETALLKKSPDVDQLFADYCQVINDCAL